MTQQGFFFDESRCLDCRACSIACQDWNDIQVGTEKYLRRFFWEEGVFPEISLHFVFAPCYHCEKPACLDACPNGAIFKESKYGAVLVDDALCVGCKSCWDACPYGAPRFSDEPKMKKCNLCIGRLEKGQLPACIDTCIPRALDFGPIDELEKKYGTCRALKAMPDPSAVKPSIIFKEAGAKQQLVPYDAEKARQLFGYRGKDFEPYYTDAAVLSDTASVWKKCLNMKFEDASKELEFMKNDEC